ncbi:MAG: putative metal-binding motif-containing protein [Planctomycetota bacterium]
MKRNLDIKIVLHGFIFALLGVSPTMAGSHLWRINEIFSNADGTVQFIELKECCGATAETALAGKPLISVATGHTFTFPSNIPGNTANKHLLIATPAFAALPGAPTPNFFFSQVPFFAVNGDTIDWAPLLNYDEFTFGVGILPTDGINSIRVTNYVTDTFVTEPNTPTNYLGQSGSVNAGCIDTDGDGYGNPGSGACPNGAAVDCNNNNAAINPGATELCNDTLDNDCDLLTDCDDSPCSLGSVCGLVDVPAVSTPALCLIVAAVVGCGGAIFRRRRS